MIYCLARKTTLDTFTFFIFQDIQFRLEDKEYEYMGDDFNVKANITSYAMDERTVQVMLLCESVHYNGRRHKCVKQRQWTVKLPPGESKLSFGRCYFLSNSYTRIKNICVFRANAGGTKKLLQLKPRMNTSADVLKFKIYRNHV